MVDKGFLLHLSMATAFPGNLTAYLTLIEAYPRLADLPLIKSGLKLTLGPALPSFI